MKLLRIYRILKVMKSYDLVTLIPPHRARKWIKISLAMLFWVRRRHRRLPQGERLRLALEALGPIWIKLGQMLSTRRDLFPPEMADQLAQLQDNVPPFDGKIARELIETALGGSIETWFDAFDEMPLASASIAQVHTATLKENNTEVVLKVIRPQILPVIESDLALMYFVAKQIPKWVEQGERLRATDIVRDYEKTILGELNLLREAANAMQLRRNFQDSPALYIPKIYLNYCRENVLVEERIYGVPVSDIETLKGWNTNLKLLAERGVEVFFTQVFRDSFFHADMHPGNIFVDITDPSNPKYIGIDCGIVGSLTKDDKRYLAENFIAFFNRDYRRIAELYVDSGWVPADTDINEFESAMRMVCEPIFAKPLSEISFGHVLMNLLSTARQFHMEIQPQLILLQKTLLYIEGLGRQLYPQLDLWVTAKPFLENWMKEQHSVKTLVKSLKSQLPYWRDALPELPMWVYQTAQQSKIMQSKLDHLTQELYTQRQLSQKKERRLFVIFALVAVGIWLFH